MLPYAAQDSYGGPHGLQRLVDACHAEGLAIFLDVVYNHFGPEGNYLGEFGRYFNDRYKTPWGAAVNYDGPGCDAVRDYVLDNVRMWLEEFHFDGLRLDAVHAIFDLGARHILRAIQEAAEESGCAPGLAGVRGRRERPQRPPPALPARSRRPRTGRPVGGRLPSCRARLPHRRAGGLLRRLRRGGATGPGLRAPVRLRLGLQPVPRPQARGAARGPLRRPLRGLPPEPRPGGQPRRGDRLDCAARIRRPKQRLAAGLLLLSPYLPLLFMGEEYGEENPFPFFCSFDDPELVEAVREGRKKEFDAFAWQGEVPDPQGEETFASARLSWSWPEGTHRAGLRRLYRDLLSARREWPALRDFERRSARLLPDAKRGPVLELVRGDEPAGGAIRAFFNLGDRPAPLPEGVPAGTAVAVPLGGRGLRRQPPRGRADRRIVPVRVYCLRPPFLEGLPRSMIEQRDGRPVEPARSDSDRPSQTSEESMASMPAAERHPMRVWPGHPYPLGATWDGAGVNFALFAENATKVELCLFDSPGCDARKRSGIPLPRADRPGLARLPARRPARPALRLPRPRPVRAGQGASLQPEQGRARSLCQGDRPRRAVGRRAVRLQGRRSGRPTCRSTTATAPRSPRWPSVIDPAFTWGDDRPPRTPWHKTFIYELHVKGFTKLNPHVPEKLRGTYAGLASESAIEHLNDLGVTAVELLPVHHHLDDRHLVEKGLTTTGATTRWASSPRRPRYCCRRQPAGRRAASSR